VSTIAVIPARGGSKGVPRKNVKPLGGRPLISYTFRVARAAERLDRVVVSTDDDEVARIAAEEGIEVIGRPAALATDESLTEDSLLHVLDTLEVRGEATPEFVVTLEPTSPLRTARLIDECLALALAKNAGAVLTVVETRECFGRLDGKRFRHLDPLQPRRRQDREPLYRESSAVYVTRTEALRASRSVLGEPLYAVVIPEEEAIDINTMHDFAVAEVLLRSRTEAQT
jgi:CMP-N,N'-diacetyllegionaminic acid synthase